MSKLKKQRPPESYEPRWAKNDDIFDVMSDMFGQAPPVTSEVPPIIEVRGPVTLGVVGLNKKLSNRQRHTNLELTKADISTAATQEPVTSERTGPIIQKAYRTRAAQDGHSMAEQQIYDTLWREARIITDEYREITIGYRALADKARLHRNTIDRNLASLQTKLAIEIIKAEDRAENIGRTYRVYGFRSILSRRESAGMIWFMKDRSGVRLLRDRDLEPNTPKMTGRLTSLVRRPITFTKPSAVTSKGVAPVITEVTTDKKEEGSFLDTSTSVVADAVSEELGYVDNDAVRRIVAGCRKHVADATAEEIANFSRITARRFRSIRNLQNPIGLLIVQVPKCFEGEAFQTYRRNECQRKEAEMVELLRLAKEILQDSEMPEDSQKWAENILAEYDPHGQPTKLLEKPVDTEKR